MSHLCARTGMAASGTLAEEGDVESGRGEQEGYLIWKAE